MGAPSANWGALQPEGDAEAIQGGGFVVRGRIQARPDELWINVKLPDGSWSYVVLREGKVVANERAESKRTAYTRALESSATADQVREHAR